ncbi:MULTISPECIES: CorA family divalent cation transporter [Chitinibacter]|uniref:CorA family divalent cation transporter n=1 Tax=Chitinibacter TaxID=230666 RepID=UPI000648B08E|nr:MULTISPECIES: CorA family divalent cation transporter [Chitinibacter]
MAPTSDILVRHFRQILIWPLQLMPMSHLPGELKAMGRQWEILQRAASEGSPWQPRATEFDTSPEQFEERHYREFITFLPYVQRFLYGEQVSMAGDIASYGRSPLHVFRRSDIQQVLMVFKDGATHHFKVAHIDLYFFYDVDVVILAFEIMGNDLPLRRVQDALFRFGRAYPAQWDGPREAANCLRKVAWLDADGEVLAESDYEERQAYLSHMGQYRAPRMAEHWAYLLNPLVPHHSGLEGEVRYRQIEYHRMPLMAYIAVDDPFALRDEDFYALGTVGKPGEDQILPLTPKLLADFEADCCFDRFWAPEQRHRSASTRMMCSGHAFIMVGQHGNEFYSNPYTGVLGQFRHQHFLLVLIAHFHKSALLLFSDRMAAALSALNLKDPLSIRHFKREIRLLLESFLRFNQRYWFREVSHQIVSSQLFGMMNRHLDTVRQHEEVRESVQSMNQYLENDDLRRQADTVVRLTVVTIFGLLGTTITGFLGMNLFDLAAESGWMKLLYFAAVSLPTAGLIFYTVARSKSLSEFLDAMSDERVSNKQAFVALRNVWRKKKAQPPV